MQYKLFKRSTFYLGLVFLFNVAAICLILTFRSQLGENFILVLVGFIIVSYIISIIYTNYDLKVDKKIIQEMVSNHQVACARIKSGKVFRVIRNAKLLKECMWQIEADIYDQDLNVIPVTFIEKFSMSQPSIPQGHIWVTYDPKNPEKIFAVPMVAISNEPALAPLAEKYEKTIKPTWLNCYYRYGIIIQSYKDSLKEKKEYEELVNTPEKKGK